MRFRYEKHLGAALSAGAIGGLVAGFTHVTEPVWQSYFVHFGMSVLAGIAYGALVEVVPIAASGTGVTFGILVLIGARGIVMPLMHLTAPIWQLTSYEQGSDFVSFAIWGWVIGVFYAYYRPRFSKRERISDSSPSEVVRLPVAESVAVF